MKLLYIPFYTLAVIIAFSIGGFLGFLSGNGKLIIPFELTNWMSAISAMISVVLTGIMARIAYLALDSWRKPRFFPVRRELIVEISKFELATYSAWAKVHKLGKSYNTSEYQTLKDEIQDFFLDLFNKYKCIKIIYQVEFFEFHSKYAIEINNNLEKINESLTWIINLLIQQNSLSSSGVMGIKEEIKNCREYISEIESKIGKITDIRK